MALSQKGSWPLVEMFLSELNMFSETIMVILMINEIILNTRGQCEIFCSSFYEPIGLKSELLII